MERVASNGQGYGRGGGHDGKWKRDKREKKLREIQTNERKNPEDMNKKRKQAGEKDRENVSERNGRMSNEKAWKTRKRARVPEGQSGEKQTGRLPKGLPESFSGDRQEDRQENRRERVPEGLPGEIAGKADGRTSYAG